MKELYKVPEAAKRAEEVGLKHHRRFKPLPIVGMLTQPEFIDSWWYIPIEEDESHVPRHAKKGLAILEEECEIVQVLVGHEVPKLLPPPPGESAAEKKANAWQEKKETLKEAARVSGSVAGKAAVGLVKGTATVVAGGALLTGYALATALSALLMVDPALIAVVRDEETGEEVWINVCDWYE